MSTLPKLSKTMTKALLVTSMLFTQPTWAQTEQNFDVLPLLKQTTLNKEEDALSLLQSAHFYQTLTKLAKTLPQAVVEQQPVFTQAALLSIRQQHQALLTLIHQQHKPLDYHYYQLFHDAQNAVHRTQTFSQALTDQFQTEVSNVSDKRLYQLDAALGWSVEGARNYAFNLYKRYQAGESLTQEQIIQLAANTQIYHVISQVIPVTKRVLQAENEKRYLIEPAVLLTMPNGIEHTATIVRKRGDKSKRPAAFQFTIYADERSHIRTATRAAANGYVGIIVNSRGKRLSKNDIVPWEHEGKDADKVIDWISKQPWCDGQVVMYGGSYNGFTQWAAAKYHHPALKAIAPYTAANMATGLPMENNIFLTGNYQWAFHVTNNNTMDQGEYADWGHWNNLYDTLFTSGKAFNEIDQIEGRPNPWFQKWLAHPSYDEYYQAMVPFGDDYKDINIPVLTVTGYYDGGQISAIDFMTQHYKHNPNANHSLLIGPYDHWSAQNTPRSHLGNYKLDVVALEKDTEETVFAWFDHLLFGEAKPRLVQNKVNYQLMGNNSWHHVDSYDALNKQGMNFYLAKPSPDKTQLLTTINPNSIAAHIQVVDMADRTTQHNLDARNVLSKSLGDQTGTIFMTEAFNSDMQYAGAPTGYFSLAVNKKDVDIGFNLYHIQPDGTAFHLTHYRSRASYANNMSKRKLLTPNEKTKIPLINTRMNARFMEKGSRIAIVLDVNKNKAAQVNMGTGKDVSTETIEDAGENLKLQWFTDSKIHLPVTPFNG